MLRARTCLGIKKRIFGGEIVETAFWNNFQDRQRPIAQHADRKFAARNEFLNQQFCIKCGCISERPLEFVAFLHYVDSNRRSLPRRFYNNRQVESWATPWVYNFPLRRLDVLLAKFLLRSDLVEGEFAFLYTVTGVGHTALLQNCLDLTILAERAVQGDKREVNTIRQIKIFIPHIDFDNFNT